MKKILLFLMLALFCIPWAANAQQAYEVQIGEGESTTGYFPFYTLYNYSIAECLFLASELEEAGVLPGEVTSLSWYATNETGYEQQGISFWMANVSDEALTTTSHVTTDMTLVYTGSVTPVTGWNEFEFNEETFTWDGTSNVLIFCQRNNGAWNSTISWQATTGLTFNAMAYKYQDSGAYDVTVSNTMYTSTNRPNIIIKGVGGSTGPTCEKPETLETDLLTESEAMISWQGGSGTYNVEYKVASAEEWEVVGENVTYTTFHFTTLQPATTYSFRVQSVCEGDAISGWKTINFTTACGAITTFPWTETFESYATGNFEDPCWVNEHIEGGGSNIFKVYTSTSGMGGNTTHMLQLPDMTGGTMTMLRLPVMNLPENYEFQIDVYRSNSTYNSNNIYEGIRVYVSTDGEIEGATELAFIPRQYNTSNDVIPAEDAVGWYTYELPIGMSGTCYVILRGESQYCTSTYMDNFVVKALPACPKPIGLVVSDVTAHGATFTWNAEEGATFQYGYEENPAEDFDPANEVPAFWDETTNNTLTWTTGFNENSDYVFYLRKNCGSDGYSEIVSVPYHTSIACPAPTGLNVNNVTAATATVNWTGTADGYNVMYRTAAYTDGIDETFTGTSIPSAWENKVGLLSDVLEGTALTTGSQWGFGNSNGVFNQHARINIYGSASSERHGWLISPSFMVLENASLTFDLALTAYSGTVAAPATSGTDDKFVVLISTDDETSWNILRQWDNEEGSNYVYNDINSTATGEHVSIDLSSYVGQNVRIAFYGESTVSNADNNLHIDNVSCGVYHEAGDWQTVTSATTTCTLTDLNPETKYDVKVESACPGEIGHETSIVSFTTNPACARPTNLAAPEAGITFESVELSWTENGIADSWYIYYTDEDGEEYPLVEATTNPFTLTGLLPESTYTIAVVPTCGVQDGDPDNSLLSASVTVTTLPFCLVPTDLTYTTHTDGVTINWSGSSDSYKVKLGYDNGSDLLTVDFEDQTIPQVCENDEDYPWTIVQGEDGYYIQSGNAGVSSSTSAISFTGEFQYDGFIEFDAECMGEGTSTFWDHCDFYIDDELMLYAGANVEGWNHYRFNITAGSHTLTWSYTKDGSVNKPGDHFAVDNLVYHRPDIVWADPIDVPDTTTTFGPLAAKTYVVAVQGVCDGETSAWSETLEFKFAPTTCTIVLNEANNYKWQETFEGKTNITTPFTGVMPECWTLVAQYSGALLNHIGAETDTLPQLFYNPAFDASNGNYTLRFKFHSLVAMPILDETVDLSRLHLSMYVRQPQTYYHLQVGILEDLNDESTFVPLAMVDNASTNMEKFECDFSRYTGTGRYIAFKNVGGSKRNPYCSNYLDNITLTYGEAKDCGIDSLPYSETFEGYVTNVGATGVEPDCWDMIAEESDIDFSTKPQIYAGFNTTPSGSYTLRMRNRCVYAMPEFTEDVDVTTLTMSFRLRQPKAVYALQVGVVDADGNFEMVEEINNESTDMVLVAVDFSSYTGNGNRIAFRNVLNGRHYPYSYNYIDDIYINYTDEAKSVSDMMDGEDASEYLNRIAVYPNPTTGMLYIDAADVQKVECYNQMGQLVGVYDNANELNISELSNGVYMLRITVPQGVTMRKVVKR